jgi:coenzyme PQQ synthesis protein D (PqqD)
MTPTSTSELPSERATGRQRLVQHERTASRVIDGKAVVISIDANQVHVLNDVGTRVWELCDGRALDDIIDQIVLEFEVDREQAARDVQVFAERLISVGAAQRIHGRG